MRIAISHRETMKGSGDAARNTPRKISDAVSIEILSVKYQYPAALTAKATLAVKWTNVEAKFFKDAQLLAYDFVTGAL